MRAGRLDKRISLLRGTESVNDMGDLTSSWAVLATVWAQVTPVSGDEREALPQMVANQQHEFRIRYSSTVADLDPLDRIAYPAVPAGYTPSEHLGNNIYQVMAVDQIGNREGLRIRGASRSDLPLATHQAPPPP